MTQNNGIKISEQTVLNSVFDEATQTLKTSAVGFDGQNVQYSPASAMATKITTVGSVTYIGKAAPGTAQATAKWQCKKITDDGAGNVTILWADGDPNYNNVATDLTALSYS